VVAVGTTTVRTLEHAAEFATKLAGKAYRGANRGVRDRSRSSEPTSFSILRHRFRIVDALLTNFHLPQSTLLMLCAPSAERSRDGRLPARSVEPDTASILWRYCMFVTKCSGKRCFS